MAASHNLNEKEAQDAYLRESAHIPEFAGRISDLCKYVWGGSLAIFYALETSDPTGPAHKFLGGQRSLLFIAATAGSLAFLFDYLQNISAYLHSRFLVQWMESVDPIPKGEFNKRTTSVFSRANGFFFFAKNIAVLLTAALIAYVILAGFLSQT